MGAPIAVAAITLDFGNTLVRVDQPSLRDVVAQTATVLVDSGIVASEATFLPVWVEERERQFREDVPEFREPDINLRAARVLARLRGMDAPVPGDHWDDVAAAAFVEPHEIETVVDAYSASFVGRMAPVADATATLARLAADGFVLAILSNWPLAATIDRFAAAQGWLPYLRAIVVSQRVGTIKPHPLIFRAAEEQLGFATHDLEAGADAPPVAERRPRPAAGGRPVPILHVGDDWAADVVGAARAGWRTAYLRERQADTPLPTSEPGDGMAVDEQVEPDLVIDELAELPGLVALDRVPSAAQAPVR